MMLSVQRVLKLQLSQLHVQAGNAAVEAGYFDQFNFGDPQGGGLRAEERLEWQDHRYRMLENASWNLVSRMVDQGHYCPEALKLFLDWAADNR